MNRSTAYGRLSASPVLVGTVTVLVTVVAIFLSYNANSGLPFVPTYDIRVDVPDASGLVRGNEVRVGGKRIGIIKTISAVDGRGGVPVARLELKLDKKAQPLRDDSKVTVRPRSPLGLKYVELQPGERGKPVGEGAALPDSAAQPIVELDEVVNALDTRARVDARRVVNELGNGLAGRGGDFNLVLSEAPALLRRLERVAANVGAPRTGLRRFVRGLDRTVGELALVVPELGSLITAANTTMGALASSRAELAQSVGELPATETAGIRALTQARPLLEDASVLAREIRPGSRLLPVATRRLHAALETGTPVLRRATRLARRLGNTLAALDALARDPVTRRVLSQALAALRSGRPTLEFVAPFQTRCNYLGLWTRNVSSTISEGDATGTWFRTLVVAGADEAQAAAEPTPQLHVNQYPHTAAPGQDGECEAGNETYIPGRQIGNVPGNQGRRTEATRPPAGVPKP